MTPTSTYMLVYSTKIPPKIIPKVIWDMILMIFINLTLVCSQRWYCKTTVHAKILGYWIAYCELCLCMCVCSSFQLGKCFSAGRSNQQREKEKSAVGIHYCWTESSATDRSAKWESSEVNSKRLSGWTIGFLQVLQLKKEREKESTPLHNKYHSKVWDR